jgi:hypothetical protein
VSQRRDAEAKERIAHGVARYHALRRGSLKVLPSDLLALAEGRAGTKASLRPHVADGTREVADLANTFGGWDQISEQRRGSALGRPSTVGPPEEGRATLRALLEDRRMTVAADAEHGFRVEGSSRSPPAARTG